MTPQLERVIIQVDQLSAEERRQLLDYLQAEAALEEEILSASIGDAIREDGSIDFAKLYQRGQSAADLHEEFPDIIDDDGHISGDLRQHE